MSIEAPSNKSGKNDEAMPQEDLVALAEILAQLDKGKEIALKKAVEKGNTDGLTGLLNRREFEERGDELLTELYGAERADQLRSVAIIFCDIDHFKDVNDTHGHDAGDKVIQAVAEALQKSIRSGDLAVRLGGEEMLVVTRNMTLEQAAEKAEDLRTSIANLSVEGLPEDFHVTVSFGVALAERGHERKTRSELLREADAAMYVSKNSGRDRVTLFQKGVTPEKPEKEDKRVTAAAGSPNPE